MAKINRAVRKKNESFYCTEDCWKQIWFTEKTTAKYHQSFANFTATGIAQRVTSKENVTKKAACRGRVGLNEDKCCVFWKKNSSSNFFSVTILKRGLDYKNVTRWTWNRDFFLLSWGKMLRCISDNLEFS